MRETIYPLSFDAEDMSKFILSQDPAVIPIASARILKQYGFPNTYTFTKSMAEQILERRKGSVPLVIIRPAIIGCSLREPMPGWVDALTAAGGVFLTSGLGLLREMQVDGACITDIVPVDYVVNAAVKLLHRVVTYHAARLDSVKSPRVPAIPGPVDSALAAAGKGTNMAANVALRTSVADSPLAVPSSGESDGTTSPLHFVYQSCTSSSLNVMRWETAKIAVEQYWNSRPHPKAVAKSDITLFASPTAYRFRVLTQRVLPIMVLKAAASLPIIGSPSRKKDIERLERAAWRSQDFQRQFHPFISNQWSFDATNTNALDDFIKPEHVKRFSCDPYEINWHAHVTAYSWGMMKFIMKSADGRSPPLMPESGTEQFVKSTL